MDMQQKNEGIDSFRVALASLDTTFVEISELFRKNSQDETNRLRDRLEALHSKVRNDLQFASKQLQESLLSLQTSLDVSLSQEIQNLEEILRRIEPPSEAGETREVLTIKELPL